MLKHVVSSAAAGEVSSAEPFRQRLQRELALRCNRNPRYSLRAFAGFLGVDHASLSQMLRGRRAISASAVRRFGGRLGLGVDEIEAHSRQVGLEPAGAEASDASIATAWDALGEWHAFALLELMRLREFRPDLRWVARVLGVTLEQAQIAVQLLLRTGYLRMEGAQWHCLAGDAVQREETFTAQLLERLGERSQEVQLASARNAPDQPRLHASVMFALRAEDLGRLLLGAQHWIEQTRRLGAGPRAGDQLYQIEVNVLPLTQPETKHG